MELVREIIMPTSNSYVLNLPDKLIGKQVEVIAFEIEGHQIIDREGKIKKLNESLADMKVDLPKFKFDRDKANKYNE
jgi:hypothetical protein